MDFSVLAFNLNRHILSIHDAFANTSFEFELDSVKILLQPELRVWFNTINDISFKISKEENLSGV